MDDREEARRNGVRLGEAGEELELPWGGVAGMAGAQ